MALAAAVGAGGAAGTSFIGMGVDAHVRGQNWSRQKNVLQKGIRWKVRDLRAAGLNPILAATGLGGGASAPSMTGSNSAGAGASTAAGMAAGTAAGRAGSEVAKNKALELAATAQAGHSNEQALNAAETRPFLKAQAEREAWNAQAAEIGLQRSIAELVPLQALADMLKDDVSKSQWQQFQLYQPKGLIEKGLTLGGEAIGGDLWDMLRNAQPRPTTAKPSGRGPKNTQKRGRASSRPYKPRTTKLR